ncbi:MAG: NAD(P)-dependent oxidoreductase [Planctomycetota bacterium]
MPEGKKILVTGGTGFVGGYFLRTALAHGHQVSSLCRPGSTSKVSIGEGVNWIPADMSSVSDEALRDHDVLVHLLAAGVTPQHVTWETAFEVNVHHSLQLWKRVLDTGVPRIVIGGSALEYGMSCRRYDPIPPDAPLEPVGAYAVSKATSSLCARELAIQKNVEIVYLRMFNLYGEGQHGENFYPALKRAAVSGEDFEMTSGRQIRDFDRVENAAKRLLHFAVDADVQKGTPIFANHGSGDPKPLLEYAKQWWAEMDAKGDLLPGAKPDRPGEVPSLRPMLPD